MANHIPNFRRYVSIHQMALERYRLEQERRHRKRMSAAIVLGFCLLLWLLMLQTLRVMFAFLAMSY
ncbi:Protein of unknown function [Gryllus bimaculatus]|nr:Protein of unknown function [Gryllus bimaculatus]